MEFDQEVKVKHYLGNINQANDLEVHLDQHKSTKVIEVLLGTVNLGDDIDELLALFSNRNSNLAKFREESNEHNYIELISINLNTNNLLTSEAEVAILKKYFMYFRQMLYPNFILSHVNITKYKHKYYLNIYGFELKAYNGEILFPISNNINYELNLKKYKYTSEDIFKYLIEAEHNDLNVRVISEINAK